MDFSLILIFIIEWGGDSMQPNLFVNMEWGQMHVNVIFSKYICHKKGIKVNNLTQDYGQN